MTLKANLIISENIIERLYLFLRRNTAIPKRLLVQYIHTNLKWLPGKQFPPTATVTFGSISENIQILRYKERHTLSDL